MSFRDLNYTVTVTWQGFAHSHAFWRVIFHEKD